MQLKKDFNLIGHSVKQLNSVLVIGFLFAIVAVFNYECHIINLFWVNKFTKGLNTILVQILYSYITGFIFYFIIEYNRLYKRKLAVFVVVNNSSYSIHHKTNFLLNEICRAVDDRPESYTITETEFDLYCNAIKIHTTSVKVWFYPESNFKDFVLKICEDVKTNSDNLLGYADLLNENWVSSLSSVNENVRFIRENLDLNESTSTLNLVAHNIWRLYAESNKIYELSNNYHSDNYQAYKKQTPIFNNRFPNLTFEVKSKKIPK